MKKQYVGYAYKSDKLSLTRATSTSGINMLSLHSCQKKLIKTLRCRKIYRNWAEKVIDRHGNKCNLCGLGGNFLHAHHKISLKELIIKNKLFNLEDAFECSDLWDIENGECLCSICHIDVIHHPSINRGLNQ